MSVVWMHVICSSLMSMVPLNVFLKYLDSLSMS